MVDLSDDHDPGSFDEVLPEAFAIIGQPDLPAERLARAAELRAICNVEGNFFPNVDYDGFSTRASTCWAVVPRTPRRSPSTRSGSPWTWPAGSAGRTARSGPAPSGTCWTGNADAILLRGARVGLIGYGNLGRALRPLLEAFAVDLRVYDPWLPDRALHEWGLVPATLDGVLTAASSSSCWPR